MFDYDPDGVRQMAGRLMLDAVREAVGGCAEARRWLDSDMAHEWAALAEIRWPPAPGVLDGLTRSALRVGKVGW